jgi:hypothetical protein
MSDMNITPTPEFLEAYRRVTGSDDTSPAAVIAAVRSPMMDEIRRVHAGIMRTKEAPSSQ